MSAPRCEHCGALLQAPTSRLGPDSAAMDVLDSLVDLGEATTPRLRAETGRGKVAVWRALQLLVALGYAQHAAELVGASPRKTVWAPTKEGRAKAARLRAAHHPTPHTAADVGREES